MPLFLPPVEIRFRFNVSLTPDPDGARRSFTVGEEFLSDELEVFHNGRRLVQSPDDQAQNGEFYVSESGGVGTGFDTIVFISFTPSSRSQLRANYFIP